MRGNGHFKYKYNTINKYIRFRGVFSNRAQQNFVHFYGFQSGNEGVRSKTNFSGSCEAERTWVSLELVEVH